MRFDEKWQQISHLEKGSIALVTSADKVKFKLHNDVCSLFFQQNIQSAAGAELSIEVKIFSVFKIAILQTGSCSKSNQNICFFYQSK